MTAIDGEPDHLGLLHRHNDLLDQPIHVGDGLFGLFFLGFLDHHHRRRGLLPQNAVLTVLEVDEGGAASCEVRRLGTITGLGQDQLELTIVGGGAERAGDERNSSWPLRALECPQNRRLTYGRADIARAFFKCF